MAGIQVFLAGHAPSLTRAPRTSLVFPKRHALGGATAPSTDSYGNPWSVTPRGRGPASGRRGGPFTRLTCHDLRHTAASLMRQAGMPAELVAERLGHADGGALLLRTYSHVRPGDTRVALDASAPGSALWLLIGDDDDVRLLNRQLVGRVEDEHVRKRDTPRSTHHREDEFVLLAP